jgi:diguanylate cyclase (GGDEF)-like protein
MTANAYAATHDALTHLPNEYLLMDRLNQAIALSERGTNLFALLMVKPDNVSQLQQRHGQAFCDQLVITVAARLQQTFREPDTITRREDNCFIILIPQIADKQALDKLILRLKKTLSEPFDIDSHSILMNFSLGQAVYPYDGTTAELLLQHVAADLH